MNLEESDLKLLHDIANRRALLKAPRTPMLRGTLAAAVRRRHELMAELARLEAQWIERGLASAGLPAASTPVSESPAPLGQRAARPYSGPDLHHF
ncbi:MAG TPA: hypothetical protein VK961_17090 [Chthoniobacter sp.]|nr:hypothetical protein [Chthoniobacter sp.]